MTVCVSLFGDSTETLAARLKVLAASRRVAELRLDRIDPRVDLDALAAARGGLQIILACVPRSQGGAWTAGEAAWEARILEAVQAFAPACLIDVPPEFERPAALDPEIPVVWSWHEAAESPETDLTTIRQQLAQRQRPGDYCKIVAWADRHEQAMRALRLLQQEDSGRLVAFAQGPGSRTARLWALALGSAWSYACWRGEATAPGQWSEHELPERKNWQDLDLHGVFGDPIEHSRSPELWMTAFRAEQVLARCRQEAAPRPAHYARVQHARLEDFRLDYAAPAFRAFSVTTPLKEQALAVADEASPLAQQVGAANFLRRLDDGRWRAEQTDGAGALAALTEQGLPESAPILLIGAGGAARGVAAEVLRRGRRLGVAARRPDAARAMLADLAERGLQGARDATVHALDASELWTKVRGGSAELGIVQATPLGSVERPGDPLPAQQFDPGCWVLDMIYHPPETALLARAREAGATTVRGHRMLLAQMLEQYRLHRGQEAPAGALGCVLEAALGLASPPILLTGPRASGKSTLGRLLAEVLDWPFLDADAELERRHGQAIRDWLPRDPQGFRAAEAALLEELSLRPACVVALGGGIVETPAALTLLAGHPRVLGLRIRPETELARRGGADERPALTDRPLAEEIRELHERRFPLYEKACSGRWIDVEGMKADSFHRLLQRLKLLL